MIDYTYPLKSAWRDFRISYERKLAYKISPEKYFRFACIKNDTHDVEYFFYTIPEKNLIFIEIPKNASSYVLTILSKIRNGIDLNVRNPHKKKDSKLPGVNEIGLLKFISMIDDPNRFVFSVVREPYARSVSCYIDKFSNVDIGDSSYISQVVEYWAKIKQRPVVIGRPITFEEFCHFVSETAVLGIDGHWALQSNIIPKQTLELDYLARFETLSEDLLTIAQKINAGSEIEDLIKKDARPYRGDKYESFYTPKTKEIIANCYAEDFRRFGYSV